MTKEQNNIVAIQINKKKMKIVITHLLLHLIVDCTVDVGS